MFEKKKKDEMQREKERVKKSCWKSRKIIIKQKIYNERRKIKKFPLFDLSSFMYINIHICIQILVKVTLN